MIQNFDPVGVAARSLQECLLVQAKNFGYDAIELAILEKHMAGRPGWDEYVARTSMFFPLPPKKA